MTGADRPFSSAPVFLGGENRSGTTLLSVILDSHPDLVVGPELDFLEPPNLGSHIRDACDLLAVGDPRVLGPGTDTSDPAWYDGAHFVKQCQRFGIEFAELRQLVGKTMAETGSNLVDFEDRCALLNTLGEYRRQRSGVNRWGVKLGRYIPRVAEFARCWPGAHFVHLIRDGRDVASSHLTSVPWGHRTVREAAESWVRIVRYPRDLAATTRYLEIRYEDLVTDPRATIRLIIDFAGVRWHDAVLRHTEVPHSLFVKPWGHPAADAASRAITDSPIGRHRTDLTADQIAEFERFAGNELRRLGYR